MTGGRGNVITRVSETAPEKLEADVLVLPLFEEGDLPSPAKELDAKLKGLLKARIQRDRFDAEAEKTLWAEVPGLATPRVLLVGLGKRSACTRDAVRNAFGAAAGEFIKRKGEVAGLAASKDPRLAGHTDAAVEGFLLGAYSFEKYRTKPADGSTLRGVTVAADRRAAARLENQLPRLRVLVEAAFLARDWVNEPANVIHPASFEKIALEIAKAQKLQAKVLREGELKKRGMRLILAVGSGSDVRPRMVHLEYRPAGRIKRRVALVGKGVTFDSGGLSLKPQQHMYGMKADMAGAAAVLATALAVSKLRLPVHLHAIFPLVENLPSGRSAKPGDVVIAKNGKSVEIENTDAEGRLILADALTYAEGLGVEAVIDLATLTGAVVVALGQDIAALYSSDSRLADRILACGEQVGEKFWRLPIETAYKRQLKSDVADLRNVGGKYAGSITAALFLSEFVEKTPWAHLDMAGPAYLDQESPTCPKGGTGFPVRTLVEFLS